MKADERKQIGLQHLAFLVDEDEFDGALERVRERTGEIWADPPRGSRAASTVIVGGRGVSDGHLLEIITKPYGDPVEL